MGTRDMRARWAAASAVASAVVVPALLLPSAAMAQAAPPPVPPVAPPVPPGAGVPTREELEAIRQQPGEQPPRLEIQGGIERSPCPLADPEYADVKVTINRVTFNNLKGATPAEMEPAWRPFAGSPQPVGVICEIRDAAATILRNKGYLAAVQVPTQRIENGEVRLETLYARVSAIRARGETRGAERKLQEYLGKLTRDEIFDRYKAERYLLLARDLPGYNVQLTLRPAGTGPGDLVGEVTVLRRPYALDFTVQNYGSHTTGRWGGQLRAQVFGLTGLGDATSIGIYSTADFREQQILQIGHEFRPGGEGLVIDGQFTYAWTKPDVPATTAAGRGVFTARTLFASLGANYPLLRTQAKNLWVGAGFDFVDQDVRFAGDLQNRDHLRIAWARARFDAVDLRSRRPQWRFGGTLELRQGLDLFDASKPCADMSCTGRVRLSRGDGDPTSTVVRADLQAEVALGRDFALAVLPRAQYAFDPVLSFEEFTAGNYTIGRGFDPGSLLGDSGLGLAVELRGPRLKPFQRFDARFQPYGFLDAARVWTKDYVSPPLGSPRRDGGGSDKLTSAGGGVRAELGDRFRLDATVAVPLEKTDFQVATGQKRSDTRFLLTLTTRLLPWRTN
jgi:hemolysin activation/secretion protein